MGTIEALAERYRDYAAVTLYGRVPGDERQQVADRFQSDPAAGLMIANPAAAGTGFTLTAADYAVYETLSWGYDLYGQSQDRNHRIGQENPVTYLRLMAEDTIDELISDALARKSAMASGILGDGASEPLIEKLSPEQFCTMLMENRLPGS